MALLEKTKSFKIKKKIPRVIVYNGAEFSCKPTLLTNMATHKQMQMCGRDTSHASHFGSYFFKDKNVINHANGLTMKDLLTKSNLALVQLIIYDESVQTHRYSTA